MYSGSIDGDLLQVIPWPTLQNMTDDDLLAIYIYLSAIPCVEGGPGEPANRCVAAAETAAIGSEKCDVKFARSALGRFHVNQQRWKAVDLPVVHSEGQPISGDLPRHHGHSLRAVGRDRLRCGERGLTCQEIRIQAW